VECNAVLHEPRKASLSRPGIALVDMTVWELVCHLESAGWSPCVVSCRIEPFKLNGQAEKLFYIKRGNKTFTKTYLLALASAVRLRAAGVSEIPHFKQAGFYTDLLRQIGMSRGKGKSVKMLKFGTDDGRDDVDMQLTASVSKSAKTGARDDLGEGFNGPKPQRRTINQCIK
jgi:hypothetical protein